MACGDPVSPEALHPGLRHARQDDTQLWWPALPHTAARAAPQSADIADAARLPLQVRDAVGVAPLLVVLLKRLLGVAQQPANRVRSSWGEFTARDGLADAESSAHEVAPPLPHAGEDLLRQRMAPLGLSARLRRLRLGTPCTKRAGVLGVRVTDAVVLTAPVSEGERITTATCFAAPTCVDEKATLQVLGSTRQAGTGRGRATLRASSGRLSHVRLHCESPSNELDSTSPAASNSGRSQVSAALGASLRPREQPTCCKRARGRGAPSRTTRPPATSHTTRHRGRGEQGSPRLMGVPSAGQHDPKT